MGIIRIDQQRLQELGEDEDKGHLLISIERYSHD